MKISRIIVAVVIIILGFEGYTLISKKIQSNQQTAQTQQSEVTADTNQSVTQDGSTQTQQTVDQAIDVSAVNVGPTTGIYLNLLGSVKASDTAKVFPVTSGQIVKMNVQEGQLVKKGDVLFEVGGLNGSPSTAKLQYQIAQANYDSAKQSYDTTVQANDTNLTVSQLQLESAQHQVNGSYDDLAVFNANIDGANRGLNILNNTFQNTQIKNQYDLENAQDGVTTLNNSISTLQDSENQLRNSYQQQMDATKDAGQIAQLQQDLNTKIAALDSQISDLNNKVTSAQVGVQSAQQGTILGLNQIQGQIVQSQTQRQVQALSEESMAAKLGLDYYGDPNSDGVKLAQVGVQGAQLKNDASLTQADAQLKLAEANLELAKIQVDGLRVKAPIDGVVTELQNKLGDTVSAQAAVTTIIGKDNFEVKVAVNADDARRIDTAQPAMVVIGGHDVPVSIKTVAPLADPTTRLVNVTLTLPKIFFRANQDLKVKLPVKFGSSVNGSSFFVPLDSVIIGTEEKYVYVIQDGKAKKTDITLGDISGDIAEVTSGLNFGDQVILAGAKDVLDGQAVTVNNQL